jgi:hypothetical protein
MKLITIGVAVALAGAATGHLTAQVGGASESQKLVTLVGCVQAGATAGQFVLASATSVPELRLGTPSLREGTTPEKALRYALTADGIELDKLVGRRVEASGSVLPQMPGSVESVQGKLSTLQKFVAKTVKDVSGDC